MTLDLIANWHNRLFSNRVKLGVIPIRQNDISVNYN